MSITIEITDDQWGHVEEYTDDKKGCKALREHLDQIGFSARCVATTRNPHVEGFNALLWDVRIGNYSFSYYGSHKDAESYIKGIRKYRDTIVYSVLCSVGLDVHCPETFEDFCADYGYDEDSREAFQLFEACAKHARELRKQGLDNLKFSYPS